MREQGVVALRSAIVSKGMTSFERSLKESLYDGLYDGLFKDTLFRRGFEDTDGLGEGMRGACRVEVTHI